MWVGVSLCACVNVQVCESLRVFGIGEMLFIALSRIFNYGVTFLWTFNLHKDEAKNNCGIGL